jgi:hypothetical protein
MFISVASIVAKSMSSKNISVRALNEVLSYYGRHLGKDLDQLYLMKDIAFIPGSI